LLEIAQLQTREFFANRPLVPELTRSNGVKLNKRVSLRRRLNALSIAALHVVQMLGRPQESVMRSSSVWRLVRRDRIAAIFQMTSSNFRRGSKARTPKPRTSPSDLAEQFRELQRLRKKVYELERRFAGKIQQGTGDDQTDPAGGKK
jgi:hypothetical protein